MWLVWISRLRVTGGFLSELDLEFSRGLNVVIGPRGAGKTTLLELVRHALGVEHADRTRAEQQAKFIRALLGSGEVVLDIEDPSGGQRLVVDADGGGRRPELSGLALMLGQNELENIASSARSRLRLIDLRAQVQGTIEPAAALAVETAELAALRVRIDELRDEVRQRVLLEQDLAALRAEEARLLNSASRELNAKREQLRVVEDDLMRTQHDVFQVGLAADESADLEARARSLQADLVDFALRELPAATNDIVQGELREAAGGVTRVATALAGLRAGLLKQSSELSELELGLRGSAEPLRAELEEAERGLGEVTARLRNLQNQLTRLERVQQEHDELMTSYGRVLERRNQFLTDGEAAAEQLFSARRGIAEEVSRQIDGRVVVVVEHLADASAFRDLLVSGLTGSGLQFRALADTLSRTVLPRQLLHLLEEGDVSALAAASGVDAARAARVISHLQAPDFLSALAHSSLQDRVDFLLLDGATTKSVETLSTGQKCAVTLPIVLTEHTRTLVLDQPEDHLDNAYLVENIVLGLNRRSAAGAQTIIATHNANIPVLGSANTVISLQSDGLRGFVSAQGSYDDPAIVSVITILMEGGIEAFATRARFYETHGQQF